MPDDFQLGPAETMAFQTLLLRVVNTLTKGEAQQRADIADNVTRVEVLRTIEGPSVVTVDLIDPDGRLRRSDLLWRQIRTGAQKGDWVMAAIDVNLPDGDPDTDRWYRLVKVNSQSRHLTTLTFEDRAVAWLKAKRGRLSISRNKSTRAQFVHRLVDEVKQNGGIDFYSPDERIKQLRATPQPLQGDDGGGASSLTNVTRVVDSSSDITIAGGKPNPEQLDNLNTAISVARGLNVASRVMKAMLVAGIGESGFTYVVNPKGYGGVFQGQVETGGHYFKATDTAEMATYFLKGGKGFQAGGAIRLAADNPAMSPGTIATLVEASGEDGSWYDKWGAEADRIIALIGTTSTVAEPAAKSMGLGDFFNEGDSLAVGCKEPLSKLLGGRVKTDAQTGRHVLAGVSGLQARYVPGHKEPKNLIVQLGTNDSDAEVFESCVNTVLGLPGVDKVWWVNIAGTGSADEFNTLLNVAAAGDDRLTVVDWKGAVDDGKVTLTGVHPDPKGYEYRAKLIAAAITGDPTTPASSSAPINLTGGGYAQFNFTRGTETDPNETSWRAIMRLADEVRWRAFIDLRKNRPVLVFLPERSDQHVKDRVEASLINQKPAATIDLDSARVTDCSFDVDTGKLVDELVVQVICAPWHFRPGTTVQVENGGPGLDKKWLIVSIQRDIAQPTSELTLRQPLLEKKEPAPGQLTGTAGTITDDTGDLAGDIIPDSRPGSPIPGQDPHAPTHETAGLPGYPAYDYMAPAGTPCVAPADGEITKLSGKDPALGGTPGGPLGYSIYLKSGTKTYYMTHLDKVLVKVGDQVKQGQQIAQVANGPASWSSPHVHMGVNG